MIFENVNICPEKKDVSLSAYIPGGGHSGGRGRPAVIVLPGGGYLACAPTEGEPVALRFAAMGYNAFVLKYSTLFRSFPARPDLSNSNPGVHYPGPMEDVGRAILAIRENEERWGVDADKIILCGFSAGGHLAGMYATHWNRPELAAALRADSELLRPSAAILCYGVLDLTLFMGPDMGPAEMERYAAFIYALSGGKSLSEEEIVKYSPAKHVGDDMPPAFIWATSADSMVSCSNSLSMAMAMAKKGLPCELHIFEEGPHALSLADESTAATAAGINPDAAKWVSLAEAWLKKRFAPSLPEIF